MAETEFFPLRTEMIYGRGSASGFCQGGPGSTFCVRDVERKAEADARQFMDNECRIKQGRLEFLLNCSGYCSPLNLDPDRNEFVNCSMNCQGRCEIQD